MANRKGSIALSAGAQLMQRWSNAPSMPVGSANMDFYNMMNDVRGLGHSARLVSAAAEQAANQLGDALVEHTKHVNKADDAIELNRIDAAINDEATRSRIDIATKFGEDADKLQSTAKTAWKEFGDKLVSESKFHDKLLVSEIQRKLSVVGTQVELDAARQETSEKKNKLVSQFDVALKGFQDSLRLEPGLALDGKFEASEAYTTLARQANVLAEEFGVNPGVLKAKIHDSIVAGQESAFKVFGEGLEQDVMQRDLRDTAILERLDQWKPVVGEEKVAAQKTVLTKLIDYNKTIADQKEQGRLSDELNDKMQQAQMLGSYADNMILSIQRHGTPNPEDKDLRKSEREQRGTDYIMQWTDKLEANAREQYSLRVAKGKSKTAQATLDAQLEKIGATRTMMLGLMKGSAAMPSFEPGGFDLLDALAAGRKGTFTSREK